MPDVARFDTGTLKLQRMIKWDVLGGHGVESLGLLCGDVSVFLC